MRTHKYVKRTGSPGNYKYWYYDPATHGLKAGEGEMHEHGKNEHARRLIAARVAGLHTMSPQEMATEVGVTSKRINEHVTNMRTKGKRKLGAAHAATPGDHAKHGHDFENEHLKEAAHSDRTHGNLETHAGYQEVTDRIHEKERNAHSLGASTPPRPARRARTPTMPPPSPGAAHYDETAPSANRPDAERAADQAAGRAARAARRAAPPATPRLADQSDSGVLEAAASRRRNAAAGGDKAAKEKELLAKLAAAGGPALPSVHTPAERAEQARQAAAAIRTSSPSSTESAELAEVEPAFGASENTIREMVAKQARGGNPYLERAKEIFHNIQHDVKPERKAVAEHVLAAIASGAKTEAQIVEKYKELSGKRIRGISGIAEDFEKATFMTLGEIIENAPINVEVERMKRGYAAKQFARLKPFLKAGFAEANPSAPPPMPTFGDIKTWTEHGGAKPGWAGTTRLAVPKDVYDAVAKKDGKPQYPPSWMPIHLMPCWNYIVQKSLSGDGQENPYQTSTPALSQGRMNLGNQAKFQEGMVIASLRKYVQMRGGPDQLTDIPANKLSELHISHSDIFKGELSDSALKKLACHKIIDPVGFLKVLKEHDEKPVKKSFILTVDEDVAPVRIFRRSYTVNLTKGDMLRKSRIEKIRRLLDEKNH